MKITAKKAIKLFNKKQAKNRVRKVPIKTAGNFQAPHTNFAEEIYQSEKTDKLLDRILNITYIIIAICAVTLIIVNIK